MLRIRLRRTGAKKRPNYRLVVADARSPRDGRFIDIVGHYNPLTEPSTVVVHREKAEQWLAKGAQPSDRVVRLFVREGLLPESALQRVRKAVKEPPAAPAPAPAPRPAAAPAAAAAAPVEATTATESEPAAAEAAEAEA